MTLEGIIVSAGNLYIATNEDKSEILSAECKFHNTAINDSDLQTHLNKNISLLNKKDNAVIHIWYFS